MHGRLLRAICDTRAIAVGLIVLQFGLSSGGHLLHAWMHAWQDGPQGCRSCTLHAASDSPISLSAEGGKEAGCEVNHSNHCCGSRQVLASSSPPVVDVPQGNLRGEEPLTVSVASRFEMLDRSIQSRADSQRCWSEDCAFYRGLHQASALAVQPAMISLDQLLERMTLPMDAAAAKRIAFSLRARGPPSV
ncbi:MAG: hypothetical protein ACK493_02000 [Planctomycetota bacterium]|jgi:hypothetical protein|nr:hypothetical protein [Blastopirellula sp.]